MSTENHTPELPRGCDIEIVERYRDDLDPEQGFGVVLPNEIQINGTLVHSDRPVIVHEIALGYGDLACETLTLLARRVFTGAERAASDPTENRS
ncbi:hypothetical protein ACFXG4_17725 [Nocardia sp. NPDC059246]|uniref:hypothetical protein n=1 Tax=unclassified Nocardia TaxID=2637762 RepID=UPI0036B3D17E